MKKEYLVDTYRDVALKQEGSHIIAPALVQIGGSVSFIDPNDQEKLALFNNEAHSIDDYAVDLSEGFYFTEVLGPLNAKADEYRNFIETALNRVRGFYKEGAVPFESIPQLYRMFEEIDFAFAQRHINVMPDPVHSICGPDSSHPYAKTTIFRTVIHVQTREKVERLFLEKFLVNYTYLEDGVENSTVTPIHGHPPNFEVAYFSQYGDQSKVLEQEFFPVYKNNPILQPDGTVSLGALSAPSFGDDLTLIPGRERVILPSTEPALFPAQTFDTVAMSHRDGFFQFSGLFRPHRVSVVDDVSRRTVFHSLITYMSRDGKVNIFTDAGKLVDVYSRQKWVGSKN